LSLATLTNLCHLPRSGRPFDMASVNVSLSEAMKDWVEAQAASGRYDSAGADVRERIRRDQDGATVWHRFRR